MAFKHHHTEVFLSDDEATVLACDQGRQQPRTLGPYDLQSTRLRQLALGPGGHHGPQAQLLHQPAPRQSGYLKSSSKAQSSGHLVQMLGTAEPQARLSDCPTPMVGVSTLSNRQLIWP